MKLNQRHIHNGCMLTGWAMVTAGAWLVNQALGLVVGGLLLILLTGLATRLAVGQQG